MSLKDYIKETDEVMKLIGQVTSVQQNLADTYTSLQTLRELSTDETASRMLGNINMQALVERIDLKMINLANDLKQLQNVITGGGVVSKQTGASTCNVGIGF